MSESRKQDALSKVEGESEPKPSETIYHIYGSGHDSPLCGKLSGNLVWGENSDKVNCVRCLHKYIERQQSENERLKAENKKLEPKLAKKGPLFYVQKQRDWLSTFSESERGAAMPTALEDACKFIVSMEESRQQLKAELATAKEERERLKEYEWMYKDLCK